MNKELMIFGASGHLGKGITRSMISKDYDRIYLFDFNISESGVKDDRITLINISDLSVEENVIKVFESVKPDKNKIFYLYSTIGGYFGGKKTWETSVEDWNKMLNMNLNSSFLIAKYFSKIVKESYAGSICFTAALTGLNEESGKSAYGVSKSALIHLVKTLADEGKEINLTVNAVAPYIIDTPPNREWMKDGNYESWIKPDEVGELVHSLFNSFNFVTGNIIKLTNRFSLKQ